MKQDKPRAAGYVILQDITYGIGDPVSKLAYQSVSVYNLLCVRFWIGTAAFLLFAHKRILADLKQLSRRQLALLLLPCLFMTMTYLISNVAITMTSPTYISFIRSLQVLIAPILARVFFRRAYPLQLIPLQIMVIVGVFLLCGGKTLVFNTGELLAVISTVACAAALVLSERALTEQIRPVTLSGLQAFTAAIVCTGCALWQGDLAALRTASVFGWAGILYLAIFCTCVGYMMQNMALESLPSRTVALLQCVYPVMTALFSAWILGEHLTPVSLLGAAIILTCVIGQNFLREAPAAFPVKVVRRFRHG